MGVDRNIDGLRNGRLELAIRDWTRRETYEAAPAIVVEHAGGYGIAMDCARDIIKLV